MGPWVPSLAVFLLIMPALSCAGTGAATPRAPLTSVRDCFQGPPSHFVRRPFLTHHVVLNLGFTLIILHVVLEYLHATPGAVSPHALCCLLVPSRFLWSLVRGLVSKSSNGLHVLRVVWSACCACWAFSPELGCSSRRLTERHRVSLLLKAVPFSLSLSSMCWTSHGLCLSVALPPGDQSRMHLNSASSGRRPRAPVSASLANPSFC